jgi:aryl-alcohol dehydrogenase-like predicted oxidoreductase
MEPWPGELVLGAAAAASVRVITRVVDYGGVFHDDVRPGHPFAEHDHRRFRPEGWVEEAALRLARMRPYAERHGLTTLQLACAWNLAHDAVHCVAPTLIQEAGPQARPIEDKRAELAAVGAGTPSALSADEVDALRALGDNTGCMALKGASAQFSGAARPDRWELDDELAAVAARWGIDPAGDLGERVAVATHGAGDG